MPQQQHRPSDPPRRARRLACRVATVLCPVLVVGVPVGAVAARDTVPPTLVVVAGGPAAAPPAVPATQPSVAAPLSPAPPVRAAPSVPSVPTAPTRAVGIACSAGTGQPAGWARSGPTDAGAAAGGALPVVAPGLLTHVLTTRHPTTHPAAVRELRRTAVCFTAPYAFRTGRGHRLTGGPLGAAAFRGLLPGCARGTAAPAAPCVTGREVVRTRAGWVARLTFLVPAG